MSPGQVAVSCQWPVYTKSRTRPDYDSRFGTRLRGEGVYADLLARRFALALKRFGFEGRRHPPFDGTRFVPPRAASPQGELF